MKALLQTAPRELAIETLPDPEGDTVAVALCGICGSDMHAWAGHDPRRPTPLVLGHEVAGHDQSGPVAVNPLVTCGTCRFCRAGRDNICENRRILSMPPQGGGFAERVAIRPENRVRVPGSVPLAAAALTEPFACGWHAVRLAARAAPLGDALVLGGGAIGLGAAWSLMAQGAEAVTLVELAPARRERLENLGFTVTDTAREADTVIDGVGIDATREAAFAHVRPGGTIAHIGLGPGNGGFDPRRATLSEITFIGTYTYTAQDFRDTAAAIFDGRIPAARHLPAITETRALADGAQAFADLAAARVAAPKILLAP